MNERLKRIIFKKLDQDLGQAEIIVDDNKSIWFIDRANNVHGRAQWSRHISERPFAVRDPACLVVLPARANRTEVRDV